MHTRPEPLSIYTEEAEFYDLPDGELADVLQPFAAGLVMCAGRMLAVLGYRDAARYREEPFERAAPAAAATVLALLPAECDARDAVFRRNVARAFWDLSEDLAAGRPPIARCGAERWALTQMLELATRVCAATDGELLAWGAPLPGENESAWQLHEDAWQLVVEGAEYSISEARQADDENADPDAADELPPTPERGWDAPRFWFSPYGFVQPREEQRGHPVWADNPGDDAPIAVGRAAELLRLGDTTNPWRTYKERHLHGGALAEVLTPQAAQLLAVAAGELSEQGYADVLHYGDRLFEREDDVEDWGWGESFLGQLPPICDGQSAAWRLAMVRSVEDLAQDLQAGRAPIPTTTAEELAFHLIVGHAKELLDYLDDEEFARGYGLPTADQFTARHRQWDALSEAFLQDEDVLYHYNQDLQQVVTDPEHPANKQLGIGDLRPRAWFAPFGNVRPRDAARGFAPKIMEQIAGGDPAAFFASAPGLTDGATPPPPSVDVPKALTEEYEHFVALTQHRFFSEQCAIEMAASLERLLTAFLDHPSLIPGHIWPLNPRVRTTGNQWLLVDDDFTLRGREEVWRLNADRSDADARSWTRRLLLDCANYALANYGRSEMDLYRQGAPPAPLDPNLADTLSTRLAELGRLTTVSGTLRHLLAQYGLSLAEVAQAAIVPTDLVQSWIRGVPPSPTQIIRCAPVLQISEDVLLDALQGRRNRFEWPLPTLPKDTVLRLGHDPEDEDCRTTGITVDGI
ncbi:helix-turn-helix domain-containing protein [Streptomyces sp. NPDC015350]|uniref:helix-turn-helix domain-containing protein n=1 Tax=Streptomyces sp. NPDC015350 TaxID=3364955 RepID=UPI0036FE8F57